MLYNKQSYTRAVELLVEWLMLRAVYAGSWAFAVLQWFYNTTFEMRHRMHRSKSRLKEDNERRGGGDREPDDFETPGVIGRRYVGSCVCGMCVCVCPPLLSLSLTLTPSVTTTTAKTASCARPLARLALQGASYRALED